MVVVVFVQDEADGQVMKEELKLGFCCASASNDHAGAHLCLDVRAGRDDVLFLGGPACLL